MNLHQFAKVSSAFWWKPELQVDAERLRIGKKYVRQNIERKKRKANIFERW